MPFKVLFAASLLAMSLPLASQVAPAAKEGGLPLTIGAGFSTYATEIVPQRFWGPAVWIDWQLNHVPGALRGLGVEVEARYLGYGQPAGLAWDFGTFGAGPLYTWRRYRRLHPYAKFLVDYGAQRNISSPRLPTWYTHDHWIVTAPGGGLEYRAWRNISVRADYEYQFWRVEWFDNHFLNPQGVTVGASYDFKAHRSYR